MRKRIVLISSLLGAVALAMLLAWAVGAQGPEPGGHKLPGHGPIEHPFEGGGSR